MSLLYIPICIWPKLTEDKTNMTDDRLTLFLLGVTPVYQY